MRSRPSLASATPLQTRTILTAFEGFELARPLRMATRSSSSSAASSSSPSPLSIAPVAPSHSRTSVFSHAPESGSLDWAPELPRSWALAASMHSSSEDHEAREAESQLLQSACLASQRPVRVTSTRADNNACDFARARTEAFPSIEDRPTVSRTPCPDLRACANAVAPARCLRRARWARGRRGRC